ncbi:MAG TPA: hypothetical protein VN517_12060 [Terriglobales bacterium]|nr:hypothetical protein [Terriglobales bacterium]
MAMHQRALVGLIAIFVCLLPVPNSVASSAAGALDLDNGYRQMYDLNFSGAHQTFAQWETQHPDDPLGPVSNAAAYLFAEFNRLKILEFDLFTQDQKFESRPKLSPKPDVRTAFDNELSKADRIATAQLSRNPHDAHALFAQVLADGLRGDYTALIEKRDLAGLSYIKSARGIAEKLLALDPTYYDAYLAVGTENYLLSLKPAPVRWILRLGGAQTNRDEGLSKLHLTADKGHYLAPYARLLLAVAALRDKDRNTARILLSGLWHEFPDNALYKKELDRIQP